MTNIVERLDALQTGGMLPVIKEAAREIERLTALAQSNDDITWELTGENVRLRAALQRIDGINDNPACFNPMIEEVLRRALGPKP